MNACMHTTLCQHAVLRGRETVKASSGRLLRPTHVRQVQPRALLCRKDQRLHPSLSSEHNTHTHTQPLQPAHLPSRVSVPTKTDTCSAAASCAGLATHGAKRQQALSLSQLHPCPHPSLPQSLPSSPPKPRLPCRPTPLATSPPEKRVLIQQQQPVTLHTALGSGQCTPVTPPTPCYTSHEVHTGPGTYTISPCQQASVRHFVASEGAHAHTAAPCGVTLS